MSRNNNKEALRSSTVQAAAIFAAVLRDLDPTDEGLPSSNQLSFDNEWFPTFDPDEVKS